MIKKRITKVLDYLLASKEILSFENRLFLSILLLGMLMTTVALTLLMIMQSPGIVIPICLAILFSLAISYYFTRFKKKFKVFIIPLTLVALLACSTIWMFDGGTKGPTILVSFVILILGLIMTPGKQRKYIFIFFIIITITIYFIEYYRPDLITNLPKEKARWIDNFVTAIFASIYIYLTISFYLKHSVTERQRLEESEEKYRTLVDNIGEGIAFVNSNEEFVYANPVAERIFGVGNGELVGKNLSEFVSKEEYSRVLIQTKISRSGQSTNYEMEIVLPEYEKRYITITSVPQFDEYKVFIGSLGIFRDNSEHRLAEQKLKENEEKYKSIFQTANVGIGLIKDGICFSANSKLLEILGVK
jgi:PAS domain S-box-containing protein